MTDISTKAIIERCDHIDHCSLNTHHQDALRMRALVAERDTLAKQAEDTARVCARQAEEIQTLTGQLAEARKGSELTADMLPDKIMASSQPNPVNDELNRLRITAFKSNSEDDRAAYFDKLSLMFQRGDLIAYGLVVEAIEAEPCPRHHDDEAVDRFAAAMKAKLAAKRADGRGGWDDKTQCSQQFLSDLLRGHVDKGDPVDVANFAMMLHQRGEVIASALHPGDMSSQGMPITFTYTNWRGETAQRTAVPKRIWFGSTDWHPEPGWLMTAHDLEKAADRDFALADCTFAAPCQSVQETGND